MIKLKNSRPHFQNIKKLLKCGRSKSGFEMSFSVIFAIIAGIAILSLAIYATIKLVSTGQETVYVEAAKSIDNYLGNLVTGIAEGVSTKISFRKETRVFFDCNPPDSENPFGKQTIGFSEESGIGKKWYESKIKISRNNKFIFANETLQGKNIYVFIKPFYMGFKVDDLIIMSSQNYCFARGTEMPRRIANDIENLNMENVKVVPNLADCGNGNITVCFGEFGCDIKVTDLCGAGCEYDMGTVQKNGKPGVYYDGNLLYAAIFSSPEIYNCNKYRLLIKMKELAKIYLGKIGEVQIKGCNSEIDTELNDMIQAVEYELASGESQFSRIYNDIQSMDRKNELAMCKIYSGETYGNV